MRFNDSNYSTKILTKIAAAGEFPFKSLHMIGNKVIVQRTVRKLKEQGYITTLGKGQLKTIRLTQMGISIIQDMNMSYYNHYMEISENHHFRSITAKNTKNGLNQMIRRHRLAEICCILDDLGVYIFPDEKPELSLTKKDNRITPGDYIFYNSLELKHTDKRQRYKTEFTRIKGALFSPGGVYSIYNINNGLIKWNNQGEQKAQVLLMDIINMNYDKSYGVEPVVDDTIIFGKDTNTILDILKPPTGKRDKNGFELLSFKNTYKNMYFIPLDIEGARLLNIIMEYNWQQRLRESVFPDEMLLSNTSTISVDCDAYNKEDDEYILLFLDGNISKLRRFKESTTDKSHNYKIICFPFQTEMLQKYMGSDFNIMEIKYDMLSEIFFEE